MPHLPGETVMLADGSGNSGRFRTTMGNRGTGPRTSISNGSRSVFVRLSRRSLATFSTVVPCYAFAYPPLRGMSEVLYALPRGLQSVQEWLVPHSGGERDIPGMDFVLFLWNAAQPQPLEIGGDEDLPGFPL